MSHPPHFAFRSRILLLALGLALATQGCGEDRLHRVDDGVAETGADPDADTGPDAGVDEDAATDTDPDAGDAPSDEAGPKPDDGPPVSDDACEPITCNTIPEGCGELDDGCGGVLQCGDCPEDPCTPLTCADAGLVCGVIADGCGSSLHCGTGCYAIDGGNWHTCALGFAGDQPRCWGRNDDRQLGTGDETDAHGPTPVAGLDGAESIAGGIFHTCALSSGQVWCWGSDRYGQLGSDVGNYGAVPVEVPLPETAKAIGVGGWHACAVGVSGDLWCWGDDMDGQLGNGPSDHSGDGPVRSLLSDVVKVDGGPFFTCALDGGGDLHCFGENTFGQVGLSPGLDLYETPQTLSLPEAVLDFSAGGQAYQGTTTSMDLTGHVCAIVASGSVLCWGSNRNGQLGLPDDVDAQHEPAVVPGLGPDVVQIAAGGQHNCALTSAGRVLCWGLNDLGQLGDGTFGGNRAEPTEVVGLDDAVMVTASNRHSCALRATGDWVCWGSGRYGMLGDGTTDDSPVPVPASF